MLEHSAKTCFKLHEYAKGHKLHKKAKLSALSKSPHLPYMNETLLKVINHYVRTISQLMTLLQQNHPLAHLVQSSPAPHNGHNMSNFFGISLCLSAHRIKLAKYSLSIFLLIR